MPHNQNSRTGYEGNPTNCSLIAMSNLGLTPDPTYYDPDSGMFNDDLIASVKNQTSVKLQYEASEFNDSWNFYSVRGFANSFTNELFLVFIEGHVGVIDNGELLNFDDNDSQKLVWYAYSVERRPR